MKIEPITEGRLRIWLDEEEAARWRLDREEPDRLGLRRFIRRVYGAAGYRPVGRLTAEMVPVAGGWLMLIGPSAPPERGPAVHHLDDPDALLTFIRQWRSEQNDPQPLCLLYELEEGYRLVVYPDIPLSHRQRRLLAEHTYLVGYGEAAAAHTAEYGNLIVAGNLLTGDGRHPPERSAEES